MEHDINTQAMRSKEVVRIDWPATFELTLPPILHSCQSVSVVLEFLPMAHQKGDRDHPMVFARPAIDLYVVYYPAAFVLLRQFFTCPSGIIRCVVEVPLLRALNQRNSSSDRVSSRQHHRE